MLVAELGENDEFDSWRREREEASEVPACASFGAAEAALITRN